MRMDTHAKCGGVMAVFRIGPFIKLKKRAELLRRATDDSDHQGKAKPARTDDGLGRTAYRNPNGKIIPGSARQYRLVLQRSTELPLPGDTLFFIDQKQ